MPRANRDFSTRDVRHITHCYHRRVFLLKFARDRRRYLHWLFEVKKRFGLAVLNYVVT
jgi:putative transposase